MGTIGRYEQCISYSKHVVGIVLIFVAAALAFNASTPVLIALIGLALVLS